MRDFAFCFSEQAVKVALTDASFSGGRSSATAAATFGGCGGAGNRNVSDLSIQTASTCLYKVKLSTGKSLLIKLTWLRSHGGPSLSIVVDHFPELIPPWKSKLLTLKKGAHFFPASSPVVALHWDFSAASYGPGPEPIGNFYVAVTVDAEAALLLGDQRGKFLEKFSEKIEVAEFSVVYRKEQVVGSVLHSVITAQFNEGSKYHEIIIRCRGGGGGGFDGEDSELSVSIDDQKVVNVAKLRWNFRGNQTVFIDGLPVDLMWDMHGWCFSGLPEHAVFLFRRRSALESRLWLAEQGALEFSLLIQAFRSPGLL
ncbi:hypothetical protein KSP40_PGU000847 [Platanthera guangdongensis]|uniref:Uncharacterized protein n=1 Tax=Platanthera guangdongensis TaxID=2320717 RepID=A0ABR2N180_9ASPA